MAKIVDLVVPNIGDFKNGLMSGEGFLGFKNGNEINGTFLDDRVSGVGNIQFVSCAINYMKNTMTHKETIKLCKIIKNHWSNK